MPYGMPKPFATAAQKNSREITFCYFDGADVKYMDLPITEALELHEHLTHVLEAVRDRDMDDFYKQKVSETCEPASGNC